jgi:hypothetical protein
LVLAPEYRVYARMAIVEPRERGGRSGARLDGSNCTRAGTSAPDARLGWILAAVFAAVAAFAFIHYRTVPAPAVVTRFEIPAPEGTYWGALDLPVLSPDGSRILFAATKRDGTRALWLRPMDSVIAQPIPGTDGNGVNPGVWSPDGRSIARWPAFLLGGSGSCLQMALATTWTGSFALRKGCTPVSNS